jgi:class 3 adenylate cyclase/predicted ATPase
MRCSKCDSDNREGRKFCAACGAPLVLACPKCGASNQPDERFCGECGAGLAKAAGPKGPEVTAIAVSGGGERRHLTVLFCDLVGSTELAARLDPEEWQETLAAYHRSAATEINRFGGHVANYLGDGVMAYFGFPEAHENDAERAARAGLAIIEAVSRLNRLRGPKLSARVGIDSGAVVVGAGAGARTDVFGETPNIAARLQAAAAPDTLVISAATYRLVAGLFHVEDRGAQMLKGVEQPMQLYRVIEPANVRGRLGALAASRGLTPFVGREDELRLLINRWQCALDGEGQVVLIIGEAGIGKSRLVQQFHERITGMPHTWIEAAAAPFYQNTPFYPVTEALWQLVWEQSLNRFDDYLHQLQGKQARSDGQTATENRTGEQLDQLQSGLLWAGLKPAEALPLIAPLMNLPLSATHPQSSGSPEQQRRRLLATLIEWLLGAARSQPLAMIIEDLHWADPSTLELIQLIAEQAANAGLLLLITARPEFRAEWPLRAHHTQVTLNRLSKRNVREMIAQVAAQNALANETLDAVVERTSGVPLFVEELTRAVLENDSAKLSGHEIPVTLRDSLMARLDRLGSAKEVLQVGSVIGSEFSYELLRAIHSLADEDLQRELRILTDADLLHVHGIAPEANYQFKHALLRDAAYEALLKSRRKQLHGLVASAINEKKDLFNEAHPEVLARHWTEAGEIELAVAEWSRAARVAEARHAFREALGSYRQALGLVEKLADDQKRAPQELQLQLSLGVILIATDGYSAPAVEEAYERARKLCQQLGDDTQLAPILGGLWQLHYLRGEFATGREIAVQLLALAKATLDPAVELQAHNLLGQASFILGELDQAQIHFEQTLRLYDPENHPKLTLLCGGEDPGVACEGFLASTLWLCGYPDHATRVSQQAIALAEKLHHPHSLAHALYGCCGVNLLYPRAPARAQAEALKTLASKHGFAAYSALATILCSAMAEQVDRGEIASMREGLAAFRATGAVAVCPYLLGLVAQACKETGSVEEGLEALNEAFTIIAKTSERFYEAELYRLKGELVLLRHGDSDGAQAHTCFQRAIEIAQRQRAKGWELRATTSLAPLLANQGRRDEACAMLAEIYNWFTEGFDTEDLKEAKALLDELRT